MNILVKRLCLYSPAHIQNMCRHLLILSLSIYNCLLSFLPVLAAAECQSYSYIDQAPGILVLKMVIFNILKFYLLVSYLFQIDWKPVKWMYMSCISWNIYSSCSTKIAQVCALCIIQVHVSVLFQQDNIIADFMISNI